jgi:undecaprenyl-diphosphatase
MELDYGASVLLGIIQGLTEFLPISSSGHLALAQRYMGLEPESPAMLLFDVLAHLGTLIAVIVVFAVPVKRYVRRLMRELGGHRPGKRYACRIALLAMAACIPTAGFGLAFKDKFEAAFDSPVVIGICLIVTGMLLAAMVKAGRGKRGWKTFRWWQAVLVGTAQAGAILPGISRSGATICVACYLGLRRRWAAEFSFLIAAPAIAGGTLLKLKDTFELPSGPLGDIAWGPIILGSVVSLAVGIVALLLLLGAVRRAKLHYFAPYCWLLGILVLVAVR